ncbi:MAG: terminase small subunit [Rhodospirillaceae bacterium]|nr:terminase small subunit [Rhodospirillaceae bacterium]
MPVSFPLPEPRIMPRFGLLSTRQEAFCRHFVACGNAAEAARRAGYAERSARQSGHALLERSHIVERVRQIRLLWRQTARAEVQILLARLEQVWQAAVAAEAPQLMLRVVRFQAELSGVSREGRCHRPDFWPVPDEDEFGEVAAASGMAAPGPLAQAVQLGRERAERALARHAAQGAGPNGSAEAYTAGADAAEAARLRAEIEERGRLLDRPAPAPDSDRDLPPIDRDAPLRPKPGFGEEPDIRDDDEAYIDGVETNWMNDVRGGCAPIEPWPDAPPHEDPFVSAQDDPDEDDPDEDGKPEDGAADDGPEQAAEQEGEPEDGRRRKGNRRTGRRRKASRRTGRRSKGSRRTAPAARPESRGSGKPNGAAHDIS